MAGQPFDRLRATAAPLEEDNLDTDQIFPGRFLRKPRTEGYADFLFHDLRFHADGAPRPEFVLNQPAHAGSVVLITGANFGCGSSREGAVWALVDAGFRAVVAPSFSDIFYNNACRNGLLPVRLPAEVVTDLRAHVAAHPDALLAIDLDAQTVTGPDGRSWRFEIDPFRKQCLLRGLDTIDLTLEQLPALEAFEHRRRAALPWIFSPDA
jgi:3-isopropylmalate/(R)-2-methylmalate dehydratase small subunit